MRNATSMLLYAILQQHVQCGLLWPQLFCIRKYLLFIFLNIIRGFRTLRLSGCQPRLQAKVIILLKLHNPFQKEFRMSVHALHWPSTENYVYVDVLESQCLWDQTDLCGCTQRHHQSIKQCHQLKLFICLTCQNYRWHFVCFFSGVSFYVHCVHFFFFLRHLHDRNTINAKVLCGARKNDQNWSSAGGGKNKHYERKSEKKNINPKLAGEGEIVFAAV